MEDSHHSHARWWKKTKVQDMVAKFSTVSWKKCSLCFLVPGWGFVIPNVTSFYFVYKLFNETIDLVFVYGFILHFCKRTHFLHQFISSKWWLLMHALLMFPDQEHKNCQSNWTPNWLQASARFKLLAISWSRSKIFEKSSLFKAQLVGYSIFTWWEVSWRRIS